MKQEYKVSFSDEGHYFPVYKGRIIKTVSAMACVSPEDYPIATSYSWWLCPQGYPCTKIDGKNVRLHKLIMPKEYSTVDHINRNRLDARRDNLRYVNKTENNYNAKLSSDNTSGYNGVSFCRTSNKYRAYIQYEGKTCNLGRFDCKNEARIARLSAEKVITQLFGVLFSDRS